MTKVLFFNGTNQYVADLFSGMKPDGFEVICRPGNLSDAEKVELVRNVEFLVLHPAVISGRILSEAKSLRLVQSLAAGYDKIDVKTAAELNIPVATNGGANAYAVAEHAVALLLALYKKIVACDRSVRAGKWRQAVNGFDTFEVVGKTVGVIGAGKIGSKVARRFKAFETNILYYDPYPSPQIEEELGARRVSLDEILQQADIITLHLPLLNETRGLIGKREFSLMKPTTAIINTSRAEVIDEAALLSALQEKRILGAGLDVFHQEPIADDHPLMKLDNVVLTPHTAGHAYEGWNRRVSFAWENIQRVAHGQAPTSLVRLS